MKLKTIIPLLFMSTTFMVSHSALAAQIVGKVDLEKVTVFLRGAELQGKSNITVPKGESEILLTQLANNINADSINVGIGDKAMILSTTLVDNYTISKDESDKLISLRSELKNLENEKDILNIQLSVIDEEIALLRGNRIDMLNKTNGTIEQAAKVVKFVKENLVSSLTQQQKLQKQISELTDKISNYESQIGIESNKDWPMKAIKVKILTEKEVTLPITLSYLTYDAGWSPTYDVRVKDISSPLSLTYKANIYQHSGLDWQHIEFVLSTANPSQGITAPDLQPWQVGIYENKKFDFFAVSKVSAPVSSMIYEDSNETKFTDYVQPTNNGLNSEFIISLPYTITGNSSNNIVTLQQKEVKANYAYVATPILDSNAFLQAEIEDWDKLAILPGKSTVFYAGNYVGESFITTRGIKDNLNISLGRDKEILISHNQNLNETSKPSFFGNDISQKFAYQIDVKNLKEKPITISIYDHLPLIVNKTIKLEDVKFDKAQWDKETGLLTWKLNLAAKQQQQLPFSFKLTYPKDKQNVLFGLYP